MKPKILSGNGNVKNRNLLLFISKINAWTIICVILLKFLEVKAHIINKWWMIANMDCYYEYLHNPLTEILFQHGVLLRLSFVKGEGGGR